MKTLRLFVFGCATVLSACGQTPSSSTQESQTLSLTGFPEGTKWPCDEYVHGFNSNEMACMQLRYHENDSHPDTDILIELKGYNDEERKKIVEAIGVFETQWNEMHKTYGPVNETEFGMCVYRGNPTELFGQNSLYPAKYQNLDTAISWSMLSLQYMFEYHHRNRVPLLIEGRSLGADRVAEAMVGQDGYNDLDGTIRMDVDDIEEYSANYWAGALMHEWLHRKGWRHLGVYETSFIAVADECIHTHNGYAFGLTGSSENVRYD